MRKPTFRRIGAFFLALLILSTIIPVSALASEKDDEKSISIAERLEMVDLIQDLCWFMFKKGLEDISQSNPNMIRSGLPMPFAALQWYAAHPDSVDYLRRSLDQVLKGDFTEEVTVLGTTIQLAMSTSGFDIMTDIRDITACLYNWENTPEHWACTTANVIAIFPGVGIIKNMDEAILLIKSSTGSKILLAMGEGFEDLQLLEDPYLLKAFTETFEEITTHGDEALDAAGEAFETAGKNADKVGEAAGEVFEAAGKNADKVDEAADEAFEAAGKNADKVGEAASEAFEAAGKNADKVDNVLTTFNDNFDKIMEVVRGAGKYGDEAMQNSSNLMKLGKDLPNKGFKTFWGLKIYLKSPGTGNAWHHLVEQCEGRVWRSNFDYEDINNIRNIISIPDDGPESVHRIITNIYARKFDFTEGKTFRDWLDSMDLTFDQYKEIGLAILSKFGTITVENDRWVFTPFK